MEDQMTNMPADGAEAELKPGVCTDCNCDPCECEEAAPTRDAAETVSEGTKEGTVEKSTEEATE